MWVLSTYEVKEVFIDQNNVGMLYITYWYVVDKCFLFV